MSTCTALIVAAGRGSRFGGPLPKQYALLAGRPVLRHTLEAYRTAPQINRLRVVIAPGDETHYQAAVHGLALPPPVLGGSSRQQSVLNGLEAMADDAPNFVAIHDAARPFVRAVDIAACLTAACGPGVDGAVLGVALADTIKRSDDGGAIIETVPRARLWRAQTPQGFPRPLIERAYREARAAKVTATDDAALCERIGLPVVVVMGSALGLKVTEDTDFARAEALFAAATA